MSTFAVQGMQDVLIDGLKTEINPTTRSVACPNFALAILVASFQNDVASHTPAPTA
jgi:hypothetical protein